MTSPHQQLALRLLADADGLLDTHQLRMKMTLASGGKREWNYDRTHALLVRMERAHLVSRHKPRNGTASRWGLTVLGATHVEAQLT